ncbi:MAG: YitT family protein, partial [Clostridia bacterium]|nr:YitT family protein [Clostridia bacterium]
MKKFLKNRKKLLGNLKTYGIITVGTMSAAVGISVFLSHANVVAGGVSGVGIILHGLCGFPIGLFMLLANIPILLLGFKILGRGFLFKTLYGTVLLSVFTDVASYISPLSNDVLLCALVGGALIGIGMGLIFLVGATTGGVDVLAKILNKLFPSVDVGKCLFFIDFLIIFAGGVLFKSYELCLYGVISLLIVTYLIDNIIQGANSAKMVYIISERYEEIADKIMHDLQRGLT